MSDTFHFRYLYFLFLCYCVLSSSSVQCSTIHDFSACRRILFFVVLTVLSLTVDSFVIHSSNPQDIQSERETPTAKQKANELFRQKQYEQHHHVIRAPTARTSSADLDTKTGPSSVTAAYLHSLHRFSSHVDDDGTIHGTSTHGQILVENEGEKYLDSLSLAKFPKSSWRNYNDNYLNKKSARVENESNDGEDEVSGESLTYLFTYLLTIFHSQSRHG